MVVPGPAACGPAVCACGCPDPRAVATHAVCVALAAGDLDRAFTLGLMDVAPCPACDVACKAMLHRVQGERAQALAARGRYRQREARLQRLRGERAQRRTAVAAVVATRAALPPAAAAALARAREKAAASLQANPSPGKNAEP